MDMQLTLVIILFVLAIIFMGRLVYNSMNSKKGCASNCGKCAADFSEIKIPETKSN
jgi:bacterioferritin-associated ferredoxin